jgi:stage II sporulation protein D
MNRKHLIFTLLALGTLFLSAQAKGPLIRVKVAQSPNEFFILPDKEMQITGYQQGKISCKYHAQEGLTARLDSGKIVLEQSGGILEAELEEVLLAPKSATDFLSLNGKKYRGKLRIVIDNQEEGLLAINLVSSEDYLKGVVPLEMGIKLITTKREREALKVQAVAARTYALAKLGQYPDRPYDLESTVADQVYGGVEVEEKIVNQAINKTSGRVLVNSNHLVKAYFHANCGGYSEAIEKAWPWKEPEKYLRPKTDSDFCSWGKNYTWSQSFSKEHLEGSISAFLAKSIRDSAFQCGNLSDLQVLEKSESGRIMLLKIITDTGEWEVKSDSIRWCFRRSLPEGPILPSTKFEFTLFKNEAGQVDSAQFNGFGNGHGVGMCQIGAIGRARAGQSFRQILAHYYPGAKLVKRY